MRQQGVVSVVYRSLIHSQRGIKIIMNRQPSWLGPALAIILFIEALSDLGKSGGILPNLRLRLW